MTSSIPLYISQIRNYLHRNPHKSLPRHVSIIMDGNGRWAKRIGKERLYGHREGMNSIRSVVSAAAKLKIPYLTLFAFSTENWQRPRGEVTALFNLLKYFCRKELTNFIKKNIRVIFIGRTDELPQMVRYYLRRTLQATRHCNGITLVIAINYGGQQEIVDAVKKLLKDKAIVENPDLLEEKLLSRYFYAPELPPVDLMIRTSGEYRLSNFLTYQSVYAELHFTPLLWPEFKEKEFLLAVQEYLTRSRRFGALNDYVDR